MRIQTQKKRSLVASALVLSTLAMLLVLSGASINSGSAEAAGAYGPSKISCLDQWIARGALPGQGHTCGDAPNSQVASCGETQDCYPTLCAADRRLGLAAYALMLAGIPRVGVPLSFSPVAIAGGVLQGIQEKNYWEQRLADIYSAFGRNVVRTCGSTNGDRFLEAQSRINSRTNYNIRISISIGLLPKGPKGLKTALATEDAVSYISSLAMLPKTWASRRTSTAPTRITVGQKIRRNISAGISVTDTSLTIRIF